ATPPHAYHFSLSVLAADVARLAVDGSCTVRGPERESRDRSTSSADRQRMTLASRTCPPPASMAETVLGSSPARSASRACVQPRCLRNPRMSSPKSFVVAATYRDMTPPGYTQFLDLAG